MTDLKLYGESTWVSPWVFHAMVALEELRVPYELVLVPLPIPPEQRAELQTRAVIGKVPVLVDGERGVAVGESLAITEYLAERFAPPAHPRLLPAAIGDRARARQLMSFVRTSLGALREDRPTTSVFQRPVTTPLSAAGAKDAAELARIVDAVLPADASFLFGAWSIADADIALALMRLVANSDPLPPRVASYARSQWTRPSIRAYLSRVPLP